jgi:PAS domain S-box-containing protein
MQFFRRMASRLLPQPRPRLKHPFRERPRMAGDQVPWGILSPQHLAGGNPPVEVPRRLLMPDGSVKCVHCLAHARRDESGSIEFVGAVTDITAAKQAEENVRRSEMEVRQLLDLSPQHTAVFGPHLGRIYCNRAALDYYGLTLEQWQSSDPLGFFHPDDRERMTREAQSKLLSASPYENEGRLLRKDGQYRWFLFRYSPTQDEQGRVTRWYAAATDIEDRKRAEEVLRESEKSVRLIVDSIAGLVAMMTPKGRIREQSCAGILRQNFRRIKRLVYRQCRAPRRPF